MLGFGWLMSYGRADTTSQLLPKDAIGSSRYYNLTEMGLAWQ